MGTGIFWNGKFDFLVVANHALSEDERDEWRARFSEASQTMFDATEGQAQFGRIHISDEGWGRGHADVILHPITGRAYATYGRYGVIGEAVNLFQDTRNGDDRTIVHEMGHHCFALRDEYTAPVLSDAIDTDGLPGQAFNVVPLVNPAHDPDDIEGSDAILDFGGILETRLVTAYLDDRVAVAPAFSEDPRTATGAAIHFQRTEGVGCAEAPGATFSLMDTYQLNPDNREFCTAENHDPDGDTAHTATYPGKSCWDVIAETMLDRWEITLTPPAGAAQPGPTTAEVPDFFEVVKQYRTMLVLDRSGSMNDDDKILGVRAGVDYWLNFQLIGEDSLGIVAFNAEQDLRLPLTPAADIDVETESDGFAQVPATGATNIRDALTLAAGQIADAPGRAVESVILLTDGIHNTPPDSVIGEVIPTFRDLGLPVFTLPVGGADVTEYPPLERLSRMTGGSVFPIPQSLEIEGANLEALVAIYLAQLGPAIHTGSTIFNFADIGAQPKTGKVADALIALDRLDREPELKEVAEVLGISDLADIEKAAKEPNMPLHVQRTLVEEQVSRATFSIHWAPAERFALYLIDPSGAPVAVDGSDVIRAATDYPYDLITVLKPKPGLWRMVAVRRRPGPATWLNLQAGCVNRQLRADARCDPTVASGAAVGLHASASFGDALTGLMVEAEIVDPAGGVHHVTLSDLSRDELGSGDYRGVFVPAMDGRHTGEIRITNRGKGRRAGGLHRLRHGKDPHAKEQKVDRRADAASFTRRVAIYFDAGPRPVPKDVEARRGVDRSPAPRVKRREKPLPPPKK